MAAQEPGPTLTNRITSLDFLRGIAILGILLANIVAFSGPVFAHGAVSPGELWLPAARLALVAGKFRGLLCILFGIGMHLHIAKRGFEPAALSRYRIRYGILAAIGALHGMLIWFGDILFMYGLVALVVVRFVRSSNRTVGIMAAIALATSTLLGILWDLLNRFGPPPHPDGLFYDEAQIFRLGTYFDQVAYRAKIWVHYLPQIPLNAFQIGGLMLVGILIARTGFIADPNRHPKVRSLLLVIGGLGLLANLTPFTSHFLRSFYPEMSIELGFGPLLSVGILAVGVLVAHNTSFRWLTNKVSNVGRTALSNYLLQSVVCTAMYYSWGGALYEQLTGLQNLGIVLCVWFVNFVFSDLWLTKFRIGPVEWVWRSLATGTKVPLLRSAPVAPPDPPVGSDVGPSADLDRRDWY